VPDAGDRSWLRGDDHLVRDRLRDELARLVKVDAFSSLGLARDVGDQAVRAAYLEAAKSFHPNRFARRDRDIVQLANEVFLRINKVYDQLRTEEGRARALAQIERQKGAQVQPQARRARTSTAPPATAAPAPTPTTFQDPAERVRQAREREGQREEEFRQAVRQLRGNRIEEALAGLKKVASESPGEKKYRVYLCYARGRNLEAAGRREEALAEYRRALALDPTFAAAHKSIEDLDGLPPDKSGGFLKRIFRR
jgi:tetratricopeptide (TPR) repeat protein